MHLHVIFLKILLLSLSGLQR